MPFALTLNGGAGEDDSPILVKVGGDKCGQTNFASNHCLFLGRVQIQVPGNEAARAG